MPTAPASAPTTVHNHDVALIVDKIARFVTEVYKSVSSYISGVNKFDKARLISYLDSIDVVHDWVLSVPELDLPETHPKDWEVEAFPVTTDVENDSVNQIVRLFAVAYEEVINSQSARQPAGLTIHDSARLRAYVEKVRKFVLDYVDKATPLDLPESAPQEAGSGHGFRGVDPTGTTR